MQKLYNLKYHENSGEPRILWLRATKHLSLATGNSSVSPLGCRTSSCTGSKLPPGNPQSVSCTKSGLMSRGLEIVKPEHLEQVTNGEHAQQSHSSCTASPASAIAPTVSHKQWSHAKDGAPHSIQKNCKCTQQKWLNFMSCET